MSGLQHIVPGTRIRARDAEWFVKRSEINSRSGQIIECVGLSEIVRDTEATYIESLERDIEVVDPRDVEFVADESSRFERSRLFLEGQLLRATPTTKKPVVATKAAINKHEFQLVPTTMALESLRARLLIADDVGLGKTLEAGMLTAELIRRNRAKRILVVATKSMLTQFQKEFWCRFSIPLTRIDSIGIRRLRNRIPSNHNPFHYIDRSIISIDTLKNDIQYRTSIESAWWDLIIIDEAHNVAARMHSGGGRSQRNKLAELLSKRSDAMILLSATPHDGRRRSFASLMTMLDSTSIVDPETYGPEDIRGLFVRRFRTSPMVQRDIRENIPSRRIEKLRVAASPLEEEAFSELVKIKEIMSNAGASSGLFALTLEKALFSSPAACAETLRNRIKRTSRDKFAHLFGADGELDLLLERVENIGKDAFGRYHRLLKLLKDINWNKRNRRDRLVIFTERIATLKWLARELRSDLNLNEKQVVELHGQMSDIETQSIVDDFGQETKPVRILVASDLASEGINLHFQAHKLIHFDLPWSLMVYQQRNGRIDRYGQKEQPLIWYLCTESKEPRIQGDLRILEVLIEKDQAVHDSLGDPPAFFESKDRNKQEKVVEEAIQRGDEPEIFSDELDRNAETKDTLEQMLIDAFGDDDNADTEEEEGEIAVTEEPEAPQARPSVYEDVFSYCKSALELLQSKGVVTNLVTDDEVMELDVPEDFLERGFLGTGRSRKIDTRWMPREAIPQRQRIRLTKNREQMERSIVLARQNDEKSWPDIQYLWEIHPVVEWLCNKTAEFFPGRQVPVMRVAGGLKSGEVLFVLNGIVPNKKGQPLIDSWPCVLFERGMSRDLRGLPFRFVSVTELETFFKPHDLQGTVPNPGDIEVGDLRQLSDDAVDYAIRYVEKLSAEVQEKLDTEFLKVWDEHESQKNRHEEAIRKRYAANGGIASIAASRREQELKEVRASFDAEWNWNEMTQQMPDEVQPFVRLVAVMRA